MAYGILIDVNGITRWPLSAEKMIGNVGRYYINDDMLRYEGERCVEFTSTILYNNNDGYMQLGCGYSTIKLVQLTEEEYNKIWYKYGKRSWESWAQSWAEHYEKHKSYSERLNEKAKWKIGDRVEISFVSSKAEKHLFGKDHKPLQFVEGHKGTVIKHAEGCLGRLEYLIEFDDCIGSKKLKYGKDGHCWWMDESRENDKLEDRLPMWDHPLLLECESIKTDQ